MKGQTLIEALLAFAILGVVLSGIVVTITASLSNATYTKNQSLASQYAQEGIDVVQSIRDSNYASFSSLNGNYCLSKGSTALTANASCPVNVDNFVRSVFIEPAPACATNVARVTLTVSWTDGKCTGGAYCHNSKLISCLSTTDPIGSP